MDYVLRTGISRRDLPFHFGPWNSFYTHFRRWCAAAVFARIWAAVAQRAQGELRYIDYALAKLHQDSANPCGGQAQRAIGRTKYGTSTKLPTVVDRSGRAVALGLVEEQCHELHTV